MTCRNWGVDDDDGLGPACNALAPICGQRCTLSKGHDREHQHWVNGRRRSGWYGDYSNDPEALASEHKSKADG
jgi:hypothetical protein